LLSQQLKAGRKPDIAIFYDGINESLVGGFSPGIPTAHWNFHSFQLIKWLLENYGQKGLPSSSDRELTTRAQATLQNYETNLRLVCMLASAYGFKTHFFWQPALAHGAKPLAPFEQEFKQARNKELGGRVHRGLN
jgi:hypothetical protein